MITEKDLLDAIAECQGVRNPKAETCLKLASYYTILDHMQTQPQKQSYSFSSEESEFLTLVRKKNQDDVLKVFDELMDVLKITNEKLYSGVIRKIAEL